MVYRMNLDGTGFTPLHTFPTAEINWPLTVVMQGSTLYGTAGGGPNFAGEIFKMAVDGSNFQVLHSFISTEGSNLPPNASLTIKDSAIYGTTQFDDQDGRGVIFQMNTDGTGYQVLHKFLSSEGSRLMAGVTLDGSTLYGTAQFGGAFNRGTVYALTVPEPSSFVLAFAACAGAAVIAVGRRRIVRLRARRWLRLPESVPDSSAN